MIDELIDGQAPSPYCALWLRGSREKQRQFPTLGPPLHSAKGGCSGNRV